MCYYKAGGEYGMKTLARICKVYKEKYPLVQIVLHTATADTVYESKWNNKKSGRDDCRGSKILINRRESEAYICDCTEYGKSSD